MHTHKKNQVMQALLKACLFNSSVMVPTPKRAATACSRMRTTEAPGECTRVCAWIQYAYTDVRVCASGCVHKCTPVCLQFGPTHCPVRGLCS